MYTHRNLHKASWWNTIGTWRWLDIRVLHLKSKISAIVLREIKFILFCSCFCRALNYTWTDKINKQKPAFNNFVQQNSTFHTTIAYLFNNEFIITSSGFWCVEALAAVKEMFCLDNGEVLDTRMRYLAIPLHSFTIMLTQIEYISLNVRCFNRRFLNFAFGISFFGISCFSLLCRRTLSKKQK